MVTAVGDNAYEQFISALDQLHEKADRAKAIGQAS